MKLIKFEKGTRTVFNENPLEAIEVCGNCGEDARYYNYCPNCREDLTTVVIKYQGNYYDLRKELK